MKMNEWSRIATTDFGKRAIGHIETTSRILGLEYHNIEHVDSMYVWYAKQNVPYSLELDLATLYHDIVYDGKPYAEERSAGAMIHDATYFPLEPDLQGLDLKEAIECVLATKKHLIGNTTPNRIAIVKADLHALATPETTRINFEKIRLEAMNLGASEIQFAEGSKKFMHELRARCLINKAKEEYQGFWQDVIDGINLTISLDNSIISKYQ